MTGDQTDLSGQPIEEDEPEAGTDPDEPREKPCNVCGEHVIPDSEDGIKRWGQVLCRDCSSRPVAYMAYCTACAWRTVNEGQEYNRGQVKQLIQSQGNNHETRKEIFEDDPDHEKRVTEIVPGAFDFEPGKYDGYQMPRGPLGAEPRDSPGVTPAIGFCPRCHTNARETTGLRGVFDCPGCTYVWKDQRIGKQTREFEDFFSQS